MLSSNRKTSSCETRRFPYPQRTAGFHTPNQTTSSFRTRSKVAQGYRIHWLRLCRGVRPPHHPTSECPGYDTKQSDGQVPVMLELWEMQSTRSLPLLPGSLWPWVVAPDRVLSMGQMELKCVLMLNWTA